MNSSNEILRVINLRVSAKPNKLIINNISFNCWGQEFFVILGKNGQGKTTLSLSITNLLNKNVFEISGNIIIDGTDILSLNERELTKFRQKKICYIPQNPFASFNPTKKIKPQFEEQSKLKEIPFETYIELMNKLELKNIDSILNKYPFELSGGILQRLSAVRCFATNPLLIIADEPTSALDKPISNQLINLFVDYVSSKKGTLIFITQDVSIAEKYANRVGLLHQGKMDLILDKNDFFKTKDNIELKIILEAFEQLKV